MPGTCRIVVVSLDSALDALIDIPESKAIIGIPFAVARSNCTLHASASMLAIPIASGYLDIPSIQNIHLLIHIARLRGAAVHHPHPVLPFISQGLIDIRDSFSAPSFTLSQKSPPEAFPMTDI